MSCDPFPAFGAALHYIASFLEQTSSFTGRKYIWKDEVAIPIVRFALRLCQALAIRVSSSQTSDACLQRLVGFT